jgi:hypothetical protein
LSDDGAPSSPPRSLRAGALVLLLVASVYGALGVHRDVRSQGRLLWDLDYYRTAAARWSAGLDPYLADGQQTGYYYCVSVTPLVASLFPDFEATALYGVIAALGVAAALWLVMGAVRTEHALLCALYALAFGNADALYAWASGNLSWFTGLLLAAALFAASRGRWLGFYCLVGVASLVKPYALALLVVPTALGVLSPWALVALVPLALDVLLAAALWPELPVSRLEAIRLGVIEPLQLRYSLAGRLSRVFAERLAPVTATVAAAAVQLGVVAALVVRLRRTARAGEQDQRRLFPLAVVVGFSTLPRMAGYDAFLFGPALFAAFQPLLANRSRWVVAAAALTLLAGLLKEGLAVLPILTLATLLLLPRPGR